jgi:hypothetical protein
MQNILFQRFAPVIRSLSDVDLDGGCSLDAKLRLAQDGAVEVCYAPFEHVNPKARVVIVGITPGRTQMLNALRECRRQLQAGASDEVALHASKTTGAFSGAMRPNLVALLDAVGLHRWLGLSSCADLFGRAAVMMQTASVLRHPVFVNGQNYNGTPNMTRHGLLRQQLVEGFGRDMQALQDAVFLPLGDKVAEALHYLADQGMLERERILDGLPHPSGANAERIAYFLGTKARGALSAKTDPDKLDQARAALIARVAALPCQ